MSKFFIIRTELKLSKLWNVPQQNLNFTGRKPLLEKIKSHLSTASESKVKPVIISACHGLGGVGKTELALEYIYLNQNNYQIICWIPSDSESSIETAYLELAKDLKIVPESTKPEEVILILKN